MTTRLKYEETLFLRIVGRFCDDEPGRDVDTRGVSTKFYIKLGGKTDKTTALRRAVVSSLRRNGLIYCPDYASVQLTEIGAKELEGIRDDEQHSHTEDQFRREIELRARWNAAQEEITKEFQVYTSTTQRAAEERKKWEFEAQQRRCTAEKVQKKGECVMLRAIRLLCKEGDRCLKADVGNYFYRVMGGKTAFRRDAFDAAFEGLVNKGFIYVPDSDQRHHHTVALTEMGASTKDNIARVALRIISFLCDDDPRNSCFRAEVGIKFHQAMGEPKNEENQAKLRRAYEALEENRMIRYIKGVDQRHLHKVSLTDRGAACERLFQFIEGNVDDDDDDDEDEGESFKILHSSISSMPCFSTPEIPSPHDEACASPENVRSGHRESTCSTNTWHRINVGDATDLYFLASADREYEMLREGAEILQLLKLRHNDASSEVMRDVKENGDGYRIENTAEMLKFMKRVCPNDQTNKRGATAFLRAVATFPYGKSKKTARREYEFVFEESDPQFQFRGSKFVVVHVHPYFFRSDGTELFHFDLDKSDAKPERMMLAQVNVRYTMKQSMLDSLLRRLDEWIEKETTKNAPQSLGWAKRLRASMTHKTGGAGALGVFNEPSKRQKDAIRKLVQAGVWELNEVTQTLPVFTMDRNRRDWIQIGGKNMVSETTPFRKALQRFFVAVQSQVHPEVVHGGKWHELRSLIGSRSRVPVIDATFSCREAAHSSASTSLIPDVGFVSVAVNKYNSPKIKNLPNPMRDSIAWLAAMRMHGARTAYPMGVLRKSPSKTAIENHVQSVADSFERDDSLRMLVVHVAGHGVQHKGEPYFLPCDADDHDFERHLNLNTLFQCLSRAKKPVLFVFDICRTDNDDDDDVAPTKEQSNATSKLGGWTFFTTTSGKGARDGTPGMINPATRALLQGIFGSRQQSLLEVLHSIASELRPHPQFSISYTNHTKADQYYLFPNGGVSIASRWDKKAEEIESMYAAAVKDGLTDLAATMKREAARMRSKASAQRQLERSIGSSDKNENLIAEIARLRKPTVSASRSPNAATKTYGNEKSTEGAPSSDPFWNITSNHSSDAAPTSYWPRAPEEKMRTAKNLLDAGYITEEDYTEFKTKVLSMLLR